MEACFQEEIKK